MIADAPDLRHFEGLVKETAELIVASGVELEFDDVAQLLRIKVWYAVKRFDTVRAQAGLRMSRPRDSRGRSPLERYVFMCLTNMRKDIEKRPRRYNSSIDEIRDRIGGAEEMGDGRPLRDWFDMRYLSVDHESVFGEVEDEEVLLPSTLTRIERRVIALRLRGAQLQEIDRELGLSRAERERVMQSVREKLDDWNPGGEHRSDPVPLLPDGAPRSHDAHSPLAA